MKISKELFDSIFQGLSFEQEDRIEVLFKVMVLGHTPARVAQNHNISRQTLNWYLMDADKQIRIKIGIPDRKIVYFDYMPAEFEKRWRQLK